MTYLVFGTWSIPFFSGFGASMFLKYRDLACKVPTNDILLLNLGGLIGLLFLLP